MTLINSNKNRDSENKFSDKLIMRIVHDMVIKKIIEETQSD